MEFDINQTNGCDELSRLYGQMFAILQEVMQNEKKFKELTPMDYSALGLYMGKFVEQEINSSVVQIMRAFRKIEMPEYYCKHCMNKEIDADVNTHHKIVRLNEQKEPLDPESVKSIPLGDAFYALMQLKQEDDEGFFKKYPWLSNSIFLEAWRNLFKFRNDVAHIGNIIDAESLKTNYKYFLRFLQFMPDLLKAKKELAPAKYVDSLPIMEHEPITDELPYFVSTDDTELPHAPKEVALRFIELLKANDMDTTEQQIKLNEILANYDLNAIIFEGDNHKKGLKDCLGNILVPAKYDGFGFIPDPIMAPRTSIIAVKEGKYVLVRMDGSGEELTEKTYDEIHLINSGHLYSPYIYRKKGLLAWGLMDMQGKEMCDCIVDKYWCGTNDITFASGDLYGFWQFNRVFIPPMYDNIEYVGEPEDPILFTLNGVQGYVRFDTSFVPLSEFEKLDEDEQWEAKNSFICMQYDDIW